MSKSKALHPFNPTYTSTTCRRVTSLRVFVPVLGRCRMPADLADECSER